MLWTDLITPAEATGFVRAELAALEVNKPSLARWLPNVEVSDITVRFLKGQAGFVQEAEFRAFDAEPSTAGSSSGQRVTLELPALGQNRPVSEYDQLRLRNASDQLIRASIFKEIKNAATAVAHRIERLRGTVLNTGKATINQGNFISDDDFGRSGTHSVTAASLWSDPTVSRMSDLNAWSDVYSATNNGTDAGAILMPRRVFRALAAGKEFATLLANGATRPGLEADVRGLLTSAGLPELFIYDRSTASGRVLPDDRLMFLPAPVDPQSGQSEMGATFWGQTLTSMDSNYAIEPSEQPGVVVGVYKNEKPPMIAEVVSDAIALPVLANANLSFVAKVL
ncbi:major capsid protein [Arthrobacter sp. NPDC080073]|uniref:major capsid protein n=1 Tax=Arthrobacter sp. NPDC080073 TaxID=3155919 RepID=UPI003437B0EA